MAEAQGAYVQTPIALGATVERYTEEEGRATAVSLGYTHGDVEDSLAFAMGERADALRASLGFYLFREPAERGTIQAVAGLEKRQNVQDGADRARADMVAVLGGVGTWPLAAERTVRFEVDGGAEFHLPLEGGWT